MWLPTALRRNPGVTWLKKTAVELNSTLRMLCVMHKRWAGPENIAASRKRKSGSYFTIWAPQGTRPPSTTARWQTLTKCARDRSSATSKGPCILSTWRDATRQCSWSERRTIFFVFATMKAVCFVLEPTLPVTSSHRTRWVLRIWYLIMSLPCSMTEWGPIVRLI